MINISVSYVQLIILLSITIVLNYLIRILINFIQSSQWYIVWKMNKEVRLKRQIKKTQKEILYEDFYKLAEFIKWLNSQFPNSQTRKQFWRDWTGMPNSAQKVWADKFLNMIKPKEEVVKKEEKND